MQDISGMQMYGPEDVVSWANESQTSLQPFAVASRIMVWRAEAGNRNLFFFFFPVFSANFQPLHFYTWLTALPKASFISIAECSSISIFVKDSQGFCFKYF